MTLTRDFSYDQLVTIKSFFTEAEWETIDAALEDYKCYADDEATEEDLIDGIPVMDRIDSIDEQDLSLIQEVRLMDKKDMQNCVMMPLMY